MASDSRSGVSSLADRRWWCLDFANTAAWHASDHPEEGLNSYADLVNWAADIGLLESGRARRLDELAAASPRAAAQVLRRAVTLREAIYRVFAAAALGGPVRGDDLATLNVALAAALGRLQIAESSGGFDWRWVEQEDQMDGMLWEVARSAADLLVSGPVDRVGHCADDRGCGFLFVDTSRNRSRRWCDMNDCGNRAKSRRYYARHRQETSDSAS